MPDEPIFDTARAGRQDKSAPYMVSTDCVSSGLSLEQAHASTLLTGMNVDVK